MEWSFNSDNKNGLWEEKKTCNGICEKMKTRLCVVLVWNKNIIVLHECLLQVKVYSRI